MRLKNRKDHFYDSQATQERKVSVFAKAADGQFQRDKKGQQERICFKNPAGNQAWESIPFEASYLEGGSEMNMLEEFYYGNINPQEKFFKRETEYAKFVRIVSDNEEKLTAYLTGEEQHLFSQLMNAQSEILDVEARERFIEGWKLGAKFMLDTFLVPRNNPFNGICED